MSPSGYRTLTLRFLYLCAVIGSSVCFTATAAEPEPRKSGPKLQYSSKGIEVPIPTADEPRVARFDAASTQAAAKYLDDGALSWIRERTCINCHTTGPYMAERPALSKLMGPPQAEIRASFAANVPLEINSDTKPAGSTSAVVWRTLGLVEWDRHITGSLSPETARSLQDMFLRQAENGRFVATGEVEIPHITTDFELSLQAARAVSSAGDWAADSTDAKRIEQIAKLKSYLKNEPPRNDYERILRLELAGTFPDTVTTEETEAAIALLTEKQHADGGWSLRDMSAVDNWRTPMSDTVLKLIRGLPDADAPESDPYMTAKAILLLRSRNIAKDDPRVQRGLTWLKSQQRESGRWWMHSLYRGNYHYITYIATAQALKALAACDELPKLE